MSRLLGLAFALLLVGEVALLVVVLVLMAHLLDGLWGIAPGLTALFLAVMVAVGIAFWRSRRSSDLERVSELSSVHPGISLSHIPISGSAGAVYMLQFLIWALVMPAVGLFYAALVAGGLFLLPVAIYVNRQRHAGVVSVGVGNLLGMLCGAVFVGVASSREFPLAGLFVVAVAIGILAAGALIWWRSRTGVSHPHLGRES